MSVEPPASTDQARPAVADQAPPGPAAVAPPSAPAGARPISRHPSFILLAAVTVLGLGLDLWSKHWAKTHFESFRPGAHHKLVVIQDMMSFIYAKNRGGAWGLLQSAPESVRRPFFLVVSVAAIVFIVSLYRKVRPDQRALKWGLPLVLGGALGNLIDRIRYGWVVDFIDVYTKVDGHAHHWPTFNVADIAICVGVVLMGIDMFTPRSRKRAAAPAATPAAAPPGGAATATEARPMPAARPAGQHEPPAAPAAPTAPTEGS